MPAALKTSSTKQHHRHSDATLLRSSMDRKAHNLSWPYASYPPFLPTPAWFSVNGVTYHPPVPGGGGEGMGMGVPIWSWTSLDTRGAPGGSNLRQQNTSQAQQETNGNNSNTAAAASQPAGDNANRAAPNSETNIRNNSGGTPVPSRPSSPMTVDAAMQCLSGQLRDAIRLCSENLAAHAEVVATAQFTTPATRNGVWRDLLNHRFKSSGFAQDGFRNFGQRLAFYMEQARRAAQSEEPMSGGNTTERRREAERRVRRLRLLRAECDEVVALSGGAARDVLDCREMLGLMRDMKRKLADARGEVEQQEQEEEEEEEQGEESNGEEAGMAEGNISSEAPAADGRKW